MLYAPEEVWLPDELSHVYARGRGGKLLEGAGADGSGGDFAPLFAMV